MKLIMLGTGNAGVSECYNTCFLLEKKNKYMLVDAGGGNTVLKQLKNVNVQLQDIETIFVTHKHIDHILGVIWLLRFMGAMFHSGQFTHDVTVYGHDEVISILESMASSLLNGKEKQQIGRHIHLVAVQDGQRVQILGNEVTFFDIHSTKAKQFGFMMNDESGRIVCCGDEPYFPGNKDYVENSEWLLHEAFCLYEQKDVFHPYEKHHSTVKDAAAIAESLKVKNLVLYHTEDKNLVYRKALYMKEAQQYFTGHIVVPDDLETIDL